MKSNEAGETLQQHQQRTSAPPEDLSRRATTSSALTSPDPATLGANYLPRLVLQEHYQDQHHQGRKQPTDHPASSCSPQDCKGTLNLAASTATARAPECPGEVPFAKTALIIRTYQNVMQRKEEGARRKHSTRHILSTTQNYQSTSQVYSSFPFLVHLSPDFVLLISLD